MPSLDVPSSDDIFMLVSGIFLIALMLTILGSIIWTQQHDNADLIGRGVNMIHPKLILRLITIAIIALCACSASAWDTRWKFRQETPSNNYGSGPTAIEMQKKFDYNSMNAFKGTTDSSSGYTVMRNLNGGTMRGYINKDGSGYLRDDKGNFHSVNTRW